MKIYILILLSIVSIVSIRLAHAEVILQAVIREAVLRGGPEVLITEQVVFSGEDVGFAGENVVFTP